MIENKPTVYNGPTLYNGDGTAYNGHGIYNIGGGNNIIYKFNLDTFDIATLNDAGRQWYDTSSRIILTKEIDCLSVGFTYGSKQYFYCPFPEFANIDKFRIKFKAGGQLPYRSFFGYNTLSFRGDNGVIDGFWCRNNNNWSLVYPESITAPKTSDIVFEKISSTKLRADITRNGVFVGSQECDFAGPDYEINLNVDYNGSSANGDIKIYELIVERL